MDDIWPNISFAINTQSCGHSINFCVSDEKSHLFIYLFNCGFLLSTRHSLCFSVIELLCVELYATQFISSSLNYSNDYKDDFMQNFDVSTTILLFSMFWIWNVWTSHWNVSVSVRSSDIISDSSKNQSYSTCGNRLCVRKTLRKTCYWMVTCIGIYFRGDSTQYNNMVLYQHQGIKDKWHNDFAQFSLENPNDKLGSVASEPLLHIFLLRILYLRYSLAINNFLSCSSSHYTF